ncbi:MAG: PEGA domain-containing protein [Deltaproteobacteria bacterium]|nr:PEGA domain-containing protein [Deltaproteobacteria bacterium]
MSALVGLASPTPAMAMGPAKAPAAKASAKGDAPGPKQASTPAAPTPEPSPSKPAIEPILPLKVRGKLAKSSRRTLAGRFEKATAAASVEPGLYRARLAVRRTGKRDYAVTVTVIDADDKTAAEASDDCKGCDLAKVGDTIDGLVGKAASTLAPAPATGPGSVKVTTVPLGAVVKVDGTDRGITPQTIELPPGSHAVVITKPGFAEHTATIEIEPEGEQAIDVQLTALSGAAASSSGPKAGRAWTISGAVILGLGVAGVATGVALILVDEEPTPFKCSDDQIDFRGVCRHRYDTLLGGALGVAAGGIAIGGGIALMVQGRRVTVRARANGEQASFRVGMQF